ncbi:MAG: GDP-mannose 4,6-dehydratase [Eubacterium sp.]|nr:GDP-mannose 4,6-dehydratase [Eubacterium sp.]
MRSFIIGGTGFVGAYLAAHLRSLGHEVAVTKMPGEQGGFAAPKAMPMPECLVGQAVEVFALDILDKEAVLRLLREWRADYIFHLAAQSSVARSWKDPGLTVDVNIKGSLHVLEALRELSAETGAAGTGQEPGRRARLLLVGSGEEYGRALPQEIPVRETACLRPGNIYAATKACQNMLGKIYAQAYGLEVVMARPFNHIGPNQQPVFAVADFCRQAAQIEAGQQEAVIRVGSLDVKRDFTDVRDVVRAYAMLAASGKAGEDYNVGSGRARGIGEMLQMVLGHSRAKIRVEVDEARLRPAEVPVMEANIGKLQEATGWAPQIALEQTVREMLDYWRKAVDCM